MTTVPTNRPVNVAGVAVEFDLVAAFTEEISRLETENSRLSQENSALRAELDAANDGVLELLHDLDAVREGRGEGGAW